MTPSFSALLANQVAAPILMITQPNSSMYLYTQGNPKARHSLRIRPGVSSSPTTSFHKKSV